MSARMPPPHPKTPVQPRQKPMQVLALGLSRTGTLSTYTALKILGYEPYHMAENILNAANGHPQGWDAAVRAKYYQQGKRWQGKDFEKMLWKYDAMTDAPCALFPEEMIEAYPDAKVVLNVRDAEKWTESVMVNFLHFLSGRWRWLYLRNFDANFGGCWYALTWTCLNIWSGGDMHNPEAYKKYGIEKHNDFVRSLVPKENLLEFHPSMGWKPLCDFLGKDVPEGEFPNINEGDSARKLLDSALTSRILVSMGEWAMLATPFAVAGGAWWWYSRQ